MLTAFQIDKVWKNMLAAETRSFYFGDLAARYTTQKRWITGISFFLSSSAAATIVAKTTSWIPLVLALGVAATTAYSMALNLDGRMAELTTNAPNDQELLGKWQDRVFAFHHLTN